MQHTSIVSSVETGTNLTRELNRFIDGKTAYASQQRRELFTLDVFHRKEMASIRFADVVNSANVLMAHLSRDAHFTMKAGESSAVAQEIVRKKLERDGLAQLEIVSAVHLTHTAFAEQADNSISLTQDRAGNEARIVDGIVGLSRRPASFKTPRSSVVEISGLHWARILSET